ncbi:MAG: hypothetical protein EPO68_15910, partial [Planctomycetota bacterium]
MQAAEVRTIVQRALGRVLAERGIEQAPTGAGTAAPWVHVEVAPASTRPSARCTIVRTSAACIGPQSLSEFAARR